LNRKLIPMSCSKKRETVPSGDLLVIFD